jgi:hypothetical protein
MKFACGIVIALAAYGATAAVPTEFAVAPDKLSFHPVVPFRAGDRIYVSSPHLDFHDIVALGRCLDPACAKMDVVRAWSAHSRHHKVGDYVNIPQDGDYVFFGSSVPWTLPGHEREGCFRSVPLNKVCSEAARMSIIDAKTSSNVFRVRFSSDSWFWVRRVRAGA